MKNKLETFKNFGSFIIDSRIENNVGQRELAKKNRRQMVNFLSKIKIIVV